jgi:hypothetical protein
MKRQLKSPHQQRPKQERYLFAGSVIRRLADDVVSFGEHPRRANDLIAEL